MNKSDNLPYRLDIDSDDFYNPAQGNTYASWSVPFTGLNTYKYVSLLSASIPKSYYMIPSGFSSFVVSNGVTTRTVTVEPGSYNYVMLKNELLTKLAATGFGSWTINYNVATYKYQFLNATANMRFIFDENSMFTNLGFFEDTYLFTAGSLTSVRPIDLQLTNVVVVESDLIKARQDSSINQRIIHSIPDQSPVNAPVVYQNGTPYETRQIMENVGQVFRITLLDNSNRPLDTQHGSNLTLLFYKEEDKRMVINIDTKGTPFNPPSAADLEGIDEKIIS